MAATQGLQSLPKLSQLFLAAKEGQSLWKFSLCPTTPLDSAHSVLKSSYKYIGGNV